MYCHSLCVSVKYFITFNRIAFCAERDFYSVLIFCRQRYQRSAAVFQRGLATRREFFTLSLKYLLFCILTLSCSVVAMIHDCVAEKSKFEYSYFLSLERKQTSGKLKMIAIFAPKSAFFFQYCFSCHFPEQLNNGVLDYYWDIFDYSLHIRGSGTVCFTHCCTGQVAIAFLMRDITVYCCLLNLFLAPRANLSPLFLFFSHIQESLSLFDMSAKNCGTFLSYHSLFFFSFP